nr:MAG TPA: hypothetical protein [Caudoviricetes sp.]
MIKVSVPSFFLAKVKVCPVDVVFDFYLCIRQF